MSAERSPDVRRSPPKNIFGGRPADPRGTGRSPRVSARIRAEPRRKVFRRANSPKSKSYLKLDKKLTFHDFAKTLKFHSMGPDTTTQEVSWPSETVKPSNRRFKRVILSLVD